MPPGRPPKERPEGTEAQTLFGSAATTDGVIRGTVTGPGLRREEFLRAIVEQAPKIGATINGLQEKTVRCGIEAYLELTRAFKGHADIQLILDSRIPAWDVWVVNAR